MKSGAITMNDVADYVQQQVTDWARDHNKKQTPELKSEGAARLLLAEGMMNGKMPGGKVTVIDPEATMTLTTDPPGAQIFINGRDTGQTTPSRLVYAPGTATQNLTVRLERKGYKPLTLAVVVERGRDTSIRQTLKRLPTAGIGEPGGSAVGAARINPKDGAEMVFIPDGEFTMGGSEYDSEKPPHRVRLTKGYWMYRTVVTVRQYEKFCQDTGRKMPPEPVYENNHFNVDWAKKDHPIVNVNWNDAIAYCRWAGVDLPTEAQWERAARGPEEFKFPWGNSFDASKLWSSKEQLGDAGGTSPVGKFPANGFGLYDMAGNVWQWCLDCYDEKFYSSHFAEQPDPINTEGDDQTRRVLRGGSWLYDTPYVFRCSHRDSFTPDGRFYIFGFRCVKP